MITLTDLPQPGAYVKAWKKAKRLAIESPEAIVSLDWKTQCKATDLPRRFRLALHKRINERGGEGWRNIDTLADIEARRDQQNLHNWLQRRIICRRLTTPKLQKRFGHLLFSDDD